MNKTGLVFAMGILLVSCESGGAPELQGRWVSSPERTLAEIPSETDLSENQLEFLREHLGQLVLVFDGERLGVAWRGEDPEEPQWQDYEVIRRDSGTVTVEAQHGTATYKLHDECISMEASWGYREYLCKAD